MRAYPHFIDFADMNLTLKQKLLGATILATVVMAGALTSLAANRLYETTKTSIYQRAEGVSSAASVGIAEWIEIRKSISQAVNEFALQGNDLTSTLVQARNAGGFDDIFFGTIDGEMHRSYPERNRTDYDPRTRPWYIDAQKFGTQIITPAYQDAITQALIVTIAEPLYDNGRFVGVVGADVLIDQLVNDVISLDVGDQAHGMLIDAQDGTLLAHPNSSLALKPISNLSRELTMNQITRSSQGDKLEELVINGQEKLFYFQPIEGTDWILALQLDKDTEQAAFNRLVVGLITASIIISSVVVFALYWLVTMLLGDLRRVSNALETIASGEADLTQRIEPRTKDEVGQLAINFNTFVSKMHDIVTQLNIVSAQLTEQAQSTNAAARQRSARVQVQQDEINMVATAVNQMAAATQEIANSAEQTAQNSGEAVTAANHGAERVGQTQKSIQSLANEVQIAASVIKDLEAHGNSISTILSTIQEIAEQTNLLALNAAIEAARAGEQGRGFAVVADEVRVLSQRTHASTTEIQSMIETLQSTTKKAVGIMSGSDKLASESVDDANMASVSLTQIENAVERISEMATQIASAAEEQALVTAEITRNTEGIRDVSDAFSEESKQAAEQASQLSQLSEQLESQIQGFKL